MKRLALHLRYIIPLALLATGLIPAQTFLPHRWAAKSVVAGGGNTFPGNITYWWVATDLTAGAVSTWTDRISGSIWAQGNAAQRPTNEADGVFFKKSAKTFLTNTVQFGTNLSTHFIIMKRQDQGGNFYDFLDASNNGTNNWYWQSGSGWVWFEGGAQAGVLGETGTNSFFDQALVSYTGSHSAGFTNGVFAATNTVHQTTIVPPWGVMGGITNNGFYGGWIKELLVWSNQSLTASDIAALHNYATSTYGYTP